MARKSIQVAVQPEVLIWARESIGKEIPDVAKRLGSSDKVVKQFEAGQKKPTLTQLETLAIYYKRPLAAFFLPAKPDEPPFPKDFRTLPEEEKKPFSEKTLLAIRRARRLQGLAVELSQELKTKFNKLNFKTNINSNPEKLAEKARKKFGVDIETQFGWKDRYRALDTWRGAVEEQGILVFQMSMSVNETRGFSLIDGEVPVIVLNSSDAAYGRIFSLFHEYAHHLIHDGGICGDMVMREGVTHDHTSIEIFCNHFAGVFLVPGKELLNHKLVKSNNKVTWQEKTLGRLSQDFSVSREVILRRLLMHKRTNEEFYKKKSSEWNEEAKKLLEKIKKRKGGGRNVPKECVRNNGKSFVSLVINNHQNGNITYSDVSDYLSVRVKHIQSITGLLE